MDRSNVLNKHSVLSPSFIAAAFALLVFAITLGGTFIWDDVGICKNDARFAGQINWAKIWTRPYWPDSIDNLYRPLTTFTYAVQRRMTGTAPMPFHLINWLLHAATSAAVAELATRCANRRAGFIAGILFALHPIHVEPVAWIVGRAELLCLLFTLLALIVFLRRPLNVWRVFLIVFAALGAILSKEQGMLLPGLLLLLYLFVRKNNDATSAERKSMKWLIISITWTTAAYIITREHYLKFEWDRSFLDPIRQPMMNSHGLDRILMPIVLLGHYVQLLIFPLHLSLDYGSHVIGWKVYFSDPYLWLGGVTCVAWISALAASIMRRSGVIAFCLLAGALVYAPTSNSISLIVMNMAERWMYMPSAFVFILVGIMLARTNSRLIYLSSAATACLLSIRATTYAYQWNNEPRLLQYSCTRQPRSSMLAVLVAENLRNNGHPDQAEHFLLSRLDKFDDCFDVWEELAKDAAYQHRFDDADRYIQTSYHLNINSMPTTLMINAMRDRWLKYNPPSTRSAVTTKP